MERYMSSVAAYGILVFTFGITGVIAGLILLYKLKKEEREKK